MGTIIPARPALPCLQRLSPGLPCWCAGLAATGRGAVLLLAGGGGFQGCAAQGLFSGATVGYLPTLITQEQSAIPRLIHVVITAKVHGPALRSKVLNTAPCIGNVGTRLEVLYRASTAPNACLWLVVLFRHIPNQDGVLW